MNIRKVTFFAAALSAALAFADPSVSGVTVRQRWPWSGVVDIQYTLTSDVPCDMEVTATWTGQSTPVALSAISGDCLNVGNGNGHIVWDPAAEGLALPLTGFTVSVTPATVASRQYLALNLKDGSVAYSATEPDWKNRPYEFLCTNMVFRRVAATTFNFGYPESQMTAQFCNNRSLERKATLSSDYYIAIFPMTTAQRRIMLDKSIAETDLRAPAGTSYDDLRGYMPEVSWPDTLHSVSNGSIVSEMRAIAANSFPAGWTIDLPTAAQWENAARAGTDATRLCYVAGSEFGVSHSEMTNIIHNAGQWTPGETLSARIGDYDPNPWGLYDTIGCVHEYVLDFRLPSGPTLQTDVVDPTGIATANADSSYTRQVRGGACRSDCTLNTCLPGGSNAGYKPSTSRSCRLCINTKPFTRTAP